MPSEICRGHGSFSEIVRGASIAAAPPPGSDGSSMAYRLGSPAILTTVTGPLGHERIERVHLSAVPPRAAVPRPGRREGSLPETFFSAQPLQLPQTHPPNGKLERLYATGAGVLKIIYSVRRARIVESHEFRAGSTGRPIVAVTGSIPVSGNSRPDSKSDTEIGEATLPNRQRNRPDEGERKNDPIPLPRTLVYRCLKNAQIVAQSRAKSRARNALRVAQLEPHIISRQADSIRPVYIRANTKVSRDYPPRLSRDEFVPMFTYLQRNRSQHLCTPRERAGQPAPRAENREWGPMDARRPVAARDNVCDAIRHVSVGGIERCSDELILGDPDAAQIHATA